MNIDNIVYFFERFSKENLVINIFVSGNIDDIIQSCNENCSVNVFSNCFDNSPYSDVDISFNDTKR